jgi:methionyl-tRNA synthetase
MAARYAEGRVPPRPASLDEGDTGLEVRFQSEKVDWDATGSSLVASVFARYESVDYAGALGLLWAWVGQLNQRIVVQAPWEMAKHPGQQPELLQFLYRLLEAIRLIAVMAWPVMPKAAERVLAMMGLAPGPPMPQDLVWGRLEPGATLPPVAPLFPRIEVADRSPRPTREKKVTDQPEPTPPAGPPAETTQAQPPAAALISIDDFARMELKVALVKSAEKIPGSKKLLKLQVDLGGEVRQIVSGIADAYAPESLVGRKVVLVANLKPAKLMGVESFGMVLAASLDGKAVLCGFDADVPPGTKVK